MKPDTELTPSRRSPAREHSLVRMLRRVAQLETNARRASARFTTWRLAIFAVGLFGSIIPHKLGWTLLGNATLAFSFMLFLIVA